MTFEELRPNEYVETYFGLLEALLELFQKPIDPVVPSAVKNPNFLQEKGGVRALLNATCGQEVLVRYLSCRRDDNAIHGRQNV